MIQYIYLRTLNSLHIIYYEDKKKQGKSTKKIYIRNNAKLKRRKSRKKLYLKTVILYLYTT